jgi:hypothetical protein
MVVKDLEKSGYSGPVVLTGSRYFGNTHANSDWDFFIDSYTAVDLTQKGWHLINSDYSKDDAICHVFEKEFFVGNIAIPVQVQLVRMFASKCLAQKVIYDDVSLRHDLTLSKERAKLVWEMTIIESTAALRERYGRRRLAVDEQWVVDFLELLP